MRNINNMIIKRHIRYKIQNDITPCKFILAHHVAHHDRSWECLGSFLANQLICCKMVELGEEILNANLINVNDKSHSKLLWFSVWNMGIFKFLRCEF